MDTSQITILVVDDELFFRKLYSDLLTSEGYQVEVCESGEAAILRLQQGPVDLVLTDLVMPGKDGLQVLHSARLLANPPDVIMATGHASVESAIEALKAGARDYLVKPFNHVELKHQVHNCLEQRRLLAENEHLKSQIQLFQAGQSLASLIDLDSLFPRALDELMRQTGATGGCGFLLRDNDKVELLATRSFGESDAEKLLGRLQAETDLWAAGHCLENLRYVDDPLGGADLSLLSLGDGCGMKGGLLLVDVPVLAEQQEQLSDIRYLCEQVQLGFENSCRFQDAQELMHTDDLTGLYNHRYMQVALEREIRRSQRYGLQFSLLFLDLDRFKQINDQHGHLAGSAALQEVGRLLRQCVRDVDTLFRYGGDEFAALLVETDGRTARIVAERIRRAIEDHVFLTEQEICSSLTATVGYGTYPSDAIDKESLLDLADQAMYLGKGSRNVIHGVEDLKS